MKSLSEVIWSNKTLEYSYVKESHLDTNYEEVKKSNFAIFEAKLVQIPIIYFQGRSIILQKHFHSNELIYLSTCSNLNTAIYLKVDYFF